MRQRHRLTFSAASRARSPGLGARHRPGTGLPRQEHHPHRHRSRSPLEELRTRRPHTLNGPRPQPPSSARTRPTPKSPNGPTTSCALARPTPTPSQPSPHRTDATTAPDTRPLPRQRAAEHRRHDQRRLPIPRPEPCRVDRPCEPTVRKCSGVGLQPSSSSSCGKSALTLIGSERGPARLHGDRSRGRIPGGSLWTTGSSTTKPVSTSTDTSGV